MKGSLNRNRFREAVLLASFAAIVLSFLSVACDNGIDLNRKEVSESIAKFALKAYGETQRAYSYQYERNHYGWRDGDYREYYATWGMLKRNKYVAENYTRGNIIEDYTVYTSVQNYSNYYSGGRYSVPPLSTFTAVAFPKYTSPPGYLATFAIREDHVLRIYLPLGLGENAIGENDDYGTRTWQPVR